MNLTPYIKAEIDAMSYDQLLFQWRFAPVGSSMFEGESGQYFSQRMKELRSQVGGQDEHVRASKSIGW